MTRTNAPMLLAVAVLPLAGCGGSSSSSSSGGSDSSPSAYVGQGNAICTQELARLNGLTQPTTPEQAVIYLPKALRIMERETARLAALDPAAPGRGELAAGLASARQLAAVLQRFLNKLRGGLVEISIFAQVQTQSATLRANLDQHFRRAGLGRCAE
jgi:hypothetical protein